MPNRESKYKIETKSFSDLDKTLILPSFQRKLVWSKTEKKNFIETLHRGHPFGSILVYQYPNETKVSLIDGLQRFTTIRDYRDNPHEYIPTTDFIQELLDVITSQDLPLSTKKHHRKIIENTLSRFIVNRDEKEIDSLLLYNFLKSDFETENINFDDKVIEILKIQDKIINEVDGYLNIYEIDIPTIVFTGSDTELATVFENLNRGGKKLSKYQVFAAQWYKYSVELSDKNYARMLLEKTIGWYEALVEERGIEIENFDPKDMKENAEINIAELCFAFGKMILETVPVFWNLKNDDLANEIGYSTMAIMLKIRNKDLSTIISEENRRLFDDPEMLEALLHSSLEIYKDINKLFQKYLHVPGDQNNFQYSIGSNFQILSFFAAFWQKRYSLDKKCRKLQTNSRSKKESRVIRKNLIKWYIYDILEGNWSGSGDSKLDQIAIENNNKYLKTVSADMLNDSMQKWYEEQLQKRSINFEPVAKMLYTIYASFNSNLYESEKFDLEHVIPKKLINKIPNSYTISGGTLGNLMFLNSSINRGKKELFIYDFIDDSVFTVNLNLIGNRDCYPSESQLRDVQIEIEKQGNDYSNTQSVIKNRGNSIINSLVANLG
ncbi:DUF262 domain-containing protein [Enterococcus dispar]|uniref:DUF262 domain-containing protein n=1 Tax=Enterococcus dispar TaxID=44009 RepID=UPI00232E6E12|nr:DUF262 domain-containing protein [Enterococcus dispar]WCG32221.1 DUF262 domain-containing protein [Enterococcus dispar]